MLTYLLAFVAAASVVIASEPLLEFSRQPGVNPVERVVMVNLVVLIPLTALTFETILRRASGSAHSGIGTIEVPPSHAVGWRVAGAWAVIGAAVLAYPTLVLAGA